RHQRLARPHEHARGGHLVGDSGRDGGRCCFRDDGKTRLARPVGRRDRGRAGWSGRQPCRRASGWVGVSTPTVAREAPPSPDEPSRRRWTALGFIAVAQLMIALGATIVSIALPSAQATLGASDADRQWVVTAYTLSFGGLLLLGGRIADFAGRKR